MVFLMDFNVKERKINVKFAFFAQSNFDMKDIFIIITITS